MSSVIPSVLPGPFKREVFGTVIEDRDASWRGHNGTPLVKSESAVTLLGHLGLQKLAGAGEQLDADAWPGGMHPKHGGLEAGFAVGRRMDFQIMRTDEDAGIPGAGMIVLERH